MYNATIDLCRYMVYYVYTRIFKKTIERGDAIMLTNKKLLLLIIREPFTCITEKQK